MYKLIFIDIDGTLLTSEHKISTGTLSAIQRVTQINKIPVILTTARPPQAVESIHAQLNLNTPVSCFNGSLIVNKLNSNNKYSILSSVTIDAGLVSKVNEIAVLQDVNISVYRLNEWFVTNHDNFIKREEQATETTSTILEKLDVQIQKWADINDGPHKILLIGGPDKINKTEFILKSWFGSYLNIFRTNEHYLEISSINASKKMALDFFIKKDNLVKNEIIAIGDNYNDMEMLQWAGLGIAMGNAPEAVKEYADFITLDNNAEGIKFALDKFIK